jgi:N-6 DNA Methylase
LCRLNYIDPACGSGAFVTTALARLLAHLASDMPCHVSFKNSGQPKWKQAEQKLKLIASCVHAIDLHPFASFLTTLNVLFLVLPLYVEARSKDHDFTIELHVFSADALERADKKTDEQMHMFAEMNSRIQLQADSYERYRKIMDAKFDHVFGNPPWGGVLKGSLAPVYDTEKKKHFKQAFPHAAQGKYDIYGLFLERAVQILSADGRFALLTQDTYLDKEWAASLREYLATKTRLDAIVDLNPFGQLFFRAMNAPCVTAGQVVSQPADGNVHCVMSHAPGTILHNLGVTARRETVIEVVQEALERLAQKKHASVQFASGSRISRRYLRDTAHDRWDLSGGPSRESFPENWFTAAELLEMRQGVTPGGCLELFLMSNKQAEFLELEKHLVRRAIKSNTLTRWHVEWNNQVIFYPYHRNGKVAQPAFSILWDEIDNPKLKQRLIHINLEDALDFDKQIDSRELEIIRQAGINNDSVAELLKHRVGLRLVKYPASAKYLVSNYDRLQARIFKKKNIRDFNRRWYEYLWPRNPAIMLAKTRILSPTLVRDLRFVLDDTGYLSDHACLMIQPTSKTATAWDKLTEAMTVVLGKSATNKELLEYCLAFLNSSYAQERLTTGHRPTPKGSYTVTEALFRELPIPVPGNKKTVQTILKCVDALVDPESDDGGFDIMQAKLAAAVRDALEPIASS